MNKYCSSFLFELQTSYIEKRQGMKSILKSQKILIMPLLFFFDFQIENRNLLKKFFRYDIMKKIKKGEYKC